MRPAGEAEQRNLVRLEALRALVLALVTATAANGECPSACAGRADTTRGQRSTGQENKSATLPNPSHRFFSSHPTAAESLAPIPATVRRPFRPP